MVLLFQKLIFSLFIFLFQQLNKLKGIEIFSSTQNFIDKSPPNLYKWIEENAHICTLVPINEEEVPELCVLELKNRYEEFYLNNNTIDKKTNLFLLKPQGPPGENKENNNAQLNEKEEEEKIFKATELIFSTQPQNIFDKNKEEKEEKNEEEEEQKHLEFDGTKINEEEFLKVFERLNNKKNLEILTTNKQTIKTTTINPENSPLN
ncbi:hypothetical protein Mgra_00005077 [Meloidogyne graminicola]|uniref:Uncharacterized protein n=1 Tax=Meloidogyne graminicola TaxID=189291 RepID=A0A8S9ZQI2_9BILA|nr:hypothetical protein Mgra_00005077 [Meloidogyne graminicola]